MQASRPTEWNGARTLPNGWQEEGKKNFDSVLERRSRDRMMVQGSVVRVLGNASVRGGGKDLDSQMRECTPGYYNNEGQFDGDVHLIAAGFAAGTSAFERNRCDRHQPDRS